MIEHLLVIILHTFPTSQPLKLSLFLNLFQRNHPRMGFTATSFLKSCHRIFCELISRLASFERSVNEGQFHLDSKQLKSHPCWNETDSANLHRKTTDQFLILTILPFSNVCFYTASNIMLFLAPISIHSNQLTAASTQLKLLSSTL